MSGLIWMLQALDQHNAPILPSQPSCSPPTIKTGADVLHLHFPKIGKCFALRKGKGWALYQSEGTFLLVGNASDLVSQHDLSKTLHISGKFRGVLRVIAVLPT